MTITKNQERLTGCRVSTTEVSCKSFLILGINAIKNCHEFVVLLNECATVLSKTNIATVM